MAPRWLCVALVAVATAACGGQQLQMDTPDGFVRYQKKDGLAFITADGVRVRSRLVRNYPKADLAFWLDAMEKHLVSRGFVAQPRRCFQTAAGREACTAEFVVPHGAEDWVMAETVMLDGDQLVVLEAAGPFARYQKSAPALAKAYLSLSPR
jgi:hypothetical protein